MSLLNTRKFWINGSNDFSLLAYNFRSSIKSRWLIFCLLLAKWHPGAASLKICVSGNRHTTNNNGDKESPWKIPHLMLTSPRFSSPLINSTHHDFILSEKSLWIFSFIPTVSKQSIIHEWGIGFLMVCFMPLIDLASSF